MSKIRRLAENDIDAVKPVNKHAYIDTLSARLLSTSCLRLDIALAKKPSLREVEDGVLGDTGFGEDGCVSSPGAVGSGFVVGRIFGAILKAYQSNV